jgi:hypothetical protein
LEYDGLEYAHIMPVDIQVKKGQLLVRIEKGPEDIQVKSGGKRTDHFYYVVRKFCFCSACALFATSQGDSQRQEEAHHVHDAHDVP